MITLRKYIHQGFLYCCIIFLIFFTSNFRLFAEEIEWLEVANTNKELMYIKPDSIRYSNKGFLLVLAKYSQIDPNNKRVINNDSFLMAIDCENRLFNKFSEKADLKQVKNWEYPTNNKLIKKTIINTCSY